MQKTSNNKFETLFKLTDSKYTNYSNMHLYNNKETICKYDSSEDILKEYYMIRIVYYTKRKEYLLKSFKKDLDIIKYKRQFIQEFIDGTIDIIKKDDDEIDKILEEKEYPKFGSEDNDKKLSYDYLLNMRIRTLTKNKIDELDKQHENKSSLYDDLFNKSEKDLWKEDLEKFLVVYRKNLEKYNKIMGEQINGDINKNNKVKATRKAKSTKTTKKK